MDMVQSFNEMFIRKDTGLCPFCGENSLEKGFKNSLSEKEFKISGLCQDCQDDFFGVDK